MKIKSQKYVSCRLVIIFMTFLRVLSAVVVAQTQQPSYLESGSGGSLCYDHTYLSGLSDGLINLLCLERYTTFTAKVPAFPGAEGAGMWSVGGRGGKVYEVTNLNDRGPGSLRQAVEAEGARIVVFRISGTIEMRSPLVIMNPYITIAGQTAPGDGICLKNYALHVATQHVIIRYIRCRPGDDMGETVDCLTVGEGGYNVIIDHCSASWGVDETLSVADHGSGPLGNVTIQWCMITESLNCSIHPKGCHGYGSLIDGCYGNRYTFHHNLYAHHRGRSPRPGNYLTADIDPVGLVLDFRNNVIYDWQGSYAGYNADGTNGRKSLTRMNFVGNYYKQGPDSKGTFAFREDTASSRAYFSDNSMDGYIPADPWSLVDFRNFSDADKQAYKQSAQIPVAPVTTDDAHTAYQRVLADAGAAAPRRDEVDLRVINNVIGGTGGIINDEGDVGGWPVLKSLPAPADSDSDGMPDDWENEMGLDPNDGSDGSIDSDGDGYTNLEEHINALV